MPTTRPPKLKPRKGRTCDVAEILGVHGSTVSRWKKYPDFPDEVEDGLYELAAVLEWHYRRKFELEAESTEPEMRGAASDSDGLERYRQARAQQEEIKLAELRGQVILLTDFSEVAAAMFAPWRAVAEHFAQLDQLDSLQMIDQANKEVLAALERLYGDDDKPNGD